MLTEDGMIKFEPQIGNTRWRIDRPEDRQGVPSGTAA